MSEKVPAEEEAKKVVKKYLSTVFNHARGQSHGRVISIDQKLCTKAYAHRWQAVKRDIAARIPSMKSELLRADIDRGGGGGGSDISASE